MFRQEILHPASLRVFEKYQSPQQRISRPFSNIWILFWNSYFVVCLFLLLLISHFFLSWQNSGARNEIVLWWWTKLKVENSFHPFMTWLECWQHSEESGQCQMLKQFLFKPTSAAWPNRQIIQSLAGLRRERTGLRCAELVLSAVAGRAFHA